MCSVVELLGAVQDNKSAYYAIDIYRICTFDGVCCGGAFSMQVFIKSAEKHPSCERN